MSFCIRKYCKPLYLHLSIRTMSNIVVRTLSGAVFITLVLVPLFFNKDFLYYPTLFIFLLLGVIEFHNLFNKDPKIQINIHLANCIVILSGAILTFSLTSLFYLPFIVFIPFIFLILLIAELYRKKEQPIINIALPMMSFLYVVIPLVMAMTFQKVTGSKFPYLAMMFILIWTNDTFAYLCGRAFGKTKLFERISPNKTWEGTIGGIICTFLMVVLATLIFKIPDPIFWYIAVLFIAPAGIFGDLVESLFKRNLGIKDSGNIMPGHGGILDRFDAALFAIPAFILWFCIYSLITT